MWYDPERLPNLLLISLVILPIKANTVNKRPLPLQPHSHKRDVSNLLGVYGDMTASENVALAIPQPVTLTKLQHLDNKQFVLRPTTTENGCILLAKKHKDRKHWDIL